MTEVSRGRRLPCSRWRLEWWRIDERMLVAGSEDDAEENAQGSSAVQVQSTPTWWWDMGKRRNQQCKTTRVRIDHCRIQLEIERGASRGVMAVMAQYLSRRLSEARGRWPTRWQDNKRQGEQANSVRLMSGDPSGAGLFCCTHTGEHGAVSRFDIRLLINPLAYAGLSSPRSPS